MTSVVVAVHAAAEDAEAAAITAATIAAAIIVATIAATTLVFPTFEMKSQSFRIQENRAAALEANFLIVKAENLCSLFFLRKRTLHQRRYLHKFPLICRDQNESG